MEFSIFTGYFVIERKSESAKVEMRHVMAQLVSRGELSRPQSTTNWQMKPFIKVAKRRQEIKGTTDWLKSKILKELD